jgi:hypothetical protein
MFLREIEFRTKDNFFMFLLARIFGKKICKNLYDWRGCFWVTGEVPNPFDEARQDDVEV